uniref:Uncharacterized protein n=1 Tax=Lactuca sativa TaxID=4236 RepID=A0A9R1VH84_LACSA|nr:hypothetical protein LSAT_V11C500271560 [Lactuca sativa]
MGGRLPSVLTSYAEMVLHMRTQKSNRWQTTKISPKIPSSFLSENFQLIEEYEIPKNLDLLNKWTIPSIHPKFIYELGTFEELGFIQTVKTTEENLTMNEDDMTVQLITPQDINRYKHIYNYLHIGLVQIAFKPLTLQGLPESFLAVLRDARNKNWKQSLMGIIESSLSHGPDRK